MWHVRGRVSLTSLILLLSLCVIILPIIHAHDPAVSSSISISRRLSSRRLLGVTLDRVNHNPAPTRVPTSIPTSRPTKIFNIDVDQVHQHDTPTKSVPTTKRKKKSDLQIWKPEDGDPDEMTSGSKVPKSNDKTKQAKKPKSPILKRVTTRIPTTIPPTPTSPPTEPAAVTEPAAEPAPDSAAEPAASTPEESSQPDAQTAPEEVVVNDNASKTQTKTTTEEQEEGHEPEHEHEADSSSKQSENTNSEDKNIQRDETPPDDDSGSHRRVSRESRHPTFPPDNTYNYGSNSQHQQPITLQQNSAIPFEKINPNDKIFEKLKLNLGIKKEEVEVVDIIEEKQPQKPQKPNKPSHEQAKPPKTPKDDTIPKKPTKQDAKKAQEDAYRKWAWGQQKPSSKPKDIDHVDKIVASLADDFAKHLQQEAAAGHDVSIHHQQQQQSSKTSTEQPPKPDKSWVPPIHSDNLSHHDYIDPKDVQFADNIDAWKQPAAPPAPKITDSNEIVQEADGTVHLKGAQPSAEGGPAGVDLGLP